MSSPGRGEVHTAQNQINSGGLLDLAEPEPHSVTQAEGGTGSRKRDSCSECGLCCLSPRLASHLSCPLPWLFAEGKKEGKERVRREGGQTKGKGEARAGERRLNLSDTSTQAAPR